MHRLTASNVGNLPSSSLDAAARVYVQYFKDLETVIKPKNIDPLVYIANQLILLNPDKGAVIQYAREFPTQAVFLPYYMSHPEDSSGNPTMIATGPLITTSADTSKLVDLVNKYFDNYWVTESASVPNPTPIVPNRTEPIITADQPTALTPLQWGALIATGAVVLLMFSGVFASKA